MFEIKSEISFPDTEQKIRQRLKSSDKFGFVENGSQLVLSRVRKLSLGGIFRLLIPRVKVRLKLNPWELSYRISPDRLAWFLLVIILGGVIQKIFLDREKHPREYPPAFVYALFVYFSVMVVLEIKKTRYFLEKSLKREEG